MTDQELDRLLSQAAPMARDLWLSSLPGDGELPQARPSPAFQRRMDRLIRRMGRSPRRVRALAQVRRAAAVALVFLAVGFSGLMVTSRPFGPRCWRCWSRSMRRSPTSVSPPRAKQIGQPEILFLPTSRRGWRRLYGSPAESGTIFVSRTTLEICWK